MSEAKYKYNTTTLSYERITPSFKGRLWKLVTFLLGGAFFASIFILMTFLEVFDSPKERKQKRENEFLARQFDVLSQRVSELDEVLGDIQHRDDNIYRVIFEADPIPQGIRRGGVGGVNRYRNLEHHDGSDLVIRTTKEVDRLSKQMYIQSKSYDEVYNLAIQKEKMLASIPAIQPVANKNLKYMASGYGMRIHPKYKTPMMHHGMDFSASIGTAIYATGDGVVTLTKKSRSGFGHHIQIDHGYGYETLYGHMSAFKVKRGQKIKRGDLIGYVGNTGTSTGPHLHYEVHKNGRPINPVNFYFNDLTPEQYEQMIQISSTPNQPFD